MTYGERLDELSYLTDGWDSYEAEAPAPLAFDNIWLFLVEVKRLGVTVRLYPSVEGGLVAVFGTRDRYADIECFNDGEVHAIISIATAEPLVWVVERGAEREAVARILEALQLDQPGSPTNAKLPATEST